MDVAYILHEGFFVYQDQFVIRFMRKSYFRELFSCHLSDESAAGQKSCPLSVPPLKEGQTGGSPLFDVR